ncbi:MAG: hypothetical protein AAB466_07785 [Verrucomicrobiota bacterium]
MAFCPAAKLWSGWDWVPGLLSFPVGLTCNSTAATGMAMARAASTQSVRACTEIPDRLFALVLVVLLVLENEDNTEDEDEDDEEDDVSD